MRLTVELSGGLEQHHMVDREDCRCRHVLGRWLDHLLKYAQAGHGHREVAVQPFLKGEEGGSGSSSSTKEEEEA